MMTQQITDGIYFLHQTGSAWIAARVEGGRLVGQTEAALADTHDTAGDAWAGVRPGADDETVEIDLAEAVIDAVMPECVDYEWVTVTRRRGGGRDVQPKLADRAAAERWGQAWSSPQEAAEAAHGDWRHGEIDDVDDGTGPFLRVWHDGEAVWYTV